MAVLASGGGTNLQALIDRFNVSGPTAARVELVVASRASAGALERARAAGIDVLVLDARDLEAAELEAGMASALESHRIEIVVLAGYLQLVPAAVVERYRGRMINVHPALLPAFGGRGMYGMRVHRAALEAGVRVTGATVHLVDERYDEGAILAQWPVPVLPGDTAESLAARVLAVEHRILPAAVEVLAADLRRRSPEGGRPSGAGDAPAGDALAFELAPVPAPAEASVLRLLGTPI
jgi:phosphoribosylglycinamide formyltransferase-1